MTRIDQIEKAVKERLAYHEADLFDYSFWDGLWTEEPQEGLLTDDEIANLGNMFDIKIVVTRK